MSAMFRPTRNEPGDKVIEARRVVVIGQDGERRTEFAPPADAHRYDTERERRSGAAAIRAIVFCSLGCIWLLATAFGIYSILAPRSPAPAPVASTVAAPAVDHVSSTGAIEAAPVATVER